MSTVFTSRPLEIDTERYFRMAEAGIFRENERVELIEGEVLEMAPIGIRHSSAVAELFRLLVVGIPSERATVWCQCTMVLSKVSAPQPDLLLLKPRADRYREAHPRPEDLLLIIEVSESSLGYDSGRKSNLYARHGIAELWILDLANRSLELRRRPSASGFESLQKLEPGTIAAPSALPDVLLDWSRIFD